MPAHKRRGRTSSFLMASLTGVCSSLTTREIEFREWAKVEKLLREATKKWNHLEGCSYNWRRVLIVNKKGSMTRFLLNCVEDFKNPITSTLTRTHGKWPVLLIFSKRGLVLKSMAQLKGVQLVDVLVYSSASVEWLQCSANIIPAVC